MLEEVFWENLLFSASACWYVLLCLFVPHALQSGFLLWRAQEGLLFYCCELIVLKNYFTVLCWIVPALWASGGGSEVSFISLCLSFGGVITVLITQLSSWSNGPQSISDLAGLLQRVWPLLILLLTSMGEASFLFNNSSCKTYLFLSTASKNRRHQLTHF